MIKGFERLYSKEEIEKKLQEEKKFMINLSEIIQEILIQVLEKIVSYHINPCIESFFYHFANKIIGYLIIYSNQFKKFHKLYIMIQKNVSLEQESTTLDYSMIQQSEPMYNIDKYSILNDTNTFNDSKILNQNSKAILLKLLYLLNQGESFSEQELELLFFRVTKLLLSNHSGLKRITYTILKMIGAQKYIHILIQSLMKDLFNKNPLIRIDALRFISVIQEEQYIQQIERFIHNAILDNDIQVSNTAYIVGINIINRFPNIVKKWQQDILFRFNQQKNMDYHALILLYEIQKNDKIIFMDVFRAPQQPQQELVNLQILKFIKDSPNKSELREELIPYLTQSIHHQEIVIFLESFDILVYHEGILKTNFQQIIMRFDNIISLNAQLIEIYSTLKKFEHLIRIFGKSEQEKLKKLIIKIELLSSYKYVSISYRSLLICINYQIDIKDKYLQYLFNLRNKTQFQYQLLEGVLELLEWHSQYGELLLDTLQLIVFSDSNQIFKLMALQIIFDILDNSIHNYSIALETLFRITLPSEFDLQFFIVNLEQSNTIQCFQYLQCCLQNKDNLLDISSKRYKQIKQQLLQIINSGVTKIKLMEVHLQNQNVLHDINK
ncbi:hypothetical protein pb186bvf_000729 [Paramecium bursaria]